MGTGRVTALFTGAALATLVGSGLGTLGTATARPAARTPDSAIATPPRVSTTRLVSAVATTTGVTKAMAAGCATGKYQKQVETYLKKLGGYGTITVDGKQSAADCAAIKKLQKRFGISSAEGIAGSTTYDVSKRLANTDVASCNAKTSGITFCVDLTHQTAWIMKNGKRLTNPTVTRTGRKGYRTPAGTFTINKRTRTEWSDPYKVWLPYWQRFIGGRGFHQTTTYIHDKWRGSHGCVNLLPQDARTYWRVGKIGMTVKVFGRRPGT